MKKKIIYIGLIWGASSILSSCMKDRLNPVPKTSVTDASAFDTPNRISSQVLSLYSALKSSNFYGGRLIVYGEIRGEDYDITDQNLVTAADVYNMNLANSATSVKGLWSQAYYTINLANVFLDGMAAKGNSVVGTALAANYNAEARLIRALSYFSLLQYFARPYADGNGSKPGLPLRLTGIVGSGFSEKPKSSVDAVYKQILDDLDFAEQNLPSTNSSALLNTTRAHKNTAIALKTRVYLAMQNYPKVVEEANKIVPTTAPFVAKSGVPHALQSNIVNVFKTPYTTTESIFSLPMSSTSGDYPGTQSQAAYYFYNNGAVGSAPYPLLATGIVSNPNWKASDARRNLIYRNTVNGRDYMAKFTTTSPQYIDYIPVIRWAEVLLNLAEAKARISTAVPDIQAISLLNAVRQRSDATTTFAPVTSTDLVSLIMTERRIELLGEGFRSLDITRLLQTFPTKGGAPAVGPTEAAYIWPMSSDEILLNPAINR
ncbi:RagB/SusD family nutrient uptake outer membrane protein [Pedobacter sp.]|uniref:RagB/SusD family nutrient uptake outer membrane protein n=1 Tax=Pedobacter sp. TaxID=1411316 RepID=UPI00396CA963